MRTCQELVYISFRGSDQETFFKGPHQYAYTTNHRFGSLNNYNLNISTKAQRVNKHKVKLQRNIVLHELTQKTSGSSLILNMYKTVFNRVQMQNSEKNCLLFEITQICVNFAYKLRKE